VLPKYCFGNPDLLVGTRLITLSRNGVPVAEKNTGTPQQKMNRNGVPVAKRRTGTPFRCVPVHFEPCVYKMSFGAVDVDFNQLFYINVKKLTSLNTMLRTIKSYVKNCKYKVR
jgi:hypothetical protein